MVGKVVGKRQLLTTNVGMDRVNWSSVPETRRTCIPQYCPDPKHTHSIETHSEDDSLWFYAVLRGRRCGIFTSLCVASPLNQAFPWTSLYYNLENRSKKKSMGWKTAYMSTPVHGRGLWRFGRGTVNTTTDTPELPLPFLHRCPLHCRPPRHRPQPRGSHRVDSLAHRVARPAMFPRPRMGPRCLPLPPH